MHRRSNNTAKSDNIYIYTSCYMNTRRTVSVGVPCFKQCRYLQPLMCPGPSFSRSCIFQLLLFCDPSFSGSANLAPRRLRYIRTFGLVMASSSFPFHRSRFCSFPTLPLPSLPFPLLPTPFLFLLSYPFLPSFHSLF